MNAVECSVKSVEQIINYSDVELNS